MPRWSGPAPTGRRACRSRWRRPTASRRSTAATFVDALPESDFTAKALLEGLPAGQDIFYRIRFADLSAPTVLGEPMTGRFRTAPADRRSVSFVWSGDTAGQGWGIDEARGGMRTLRDDAEEPARLLHPQRRHHLRRRADRRRGEVAGRHALEELVTEEKSKPAETLAEFRGNFKYNLMDKNLLAFNAEVPMFAQWDDHEVTNNWWPGEDADRRQAPHDAIPDKNALAARGARQPRLPRIHADPPDAERSRPRLSQDCLRPAARRVHARHAELSRPERRGQRGQPTVRPPISSGRSRWPGSSAN